MKNMKTTPPHIDYIRRVWVITILLSCLLIASTASASKVSDTAPEISSASLAHDTISNYTGAENCMVCHRQAGRDFVTSIHNTWQGTATNVIGKEGMETGKRKAVNEFCGTIASNEAMCGKCHAGYGLIEGDFSMEKIDCLICHAPDYAKTATGPDPSIDATAAARNVAAPTREMCLRCHATAGGGDNRKRGDVELGMMTDLELEMMSNPRPAVGDLDAAMGAADVPRDLDVHMSADMTCQDCHNFKDNQHHVPGRGMDLRVDDTDTVLSCDSCHSTAHSGSLAVDSFIKDEHMDRISCTVCHITSYGKEHPVEIARNWELPFMAGMRTEVSNPAPIQVWWNRKSEILDLEDPVVFDSNGDVIMAKPVGDIGDPTSKIYAARLHLGRSPWDGTYMLAFNVPTAKGTKNMTEAVRVATGVTYDPLQFINSTRYLGIFHGVAPKEDALTCSDCHADHKLDFEALGYDNIEKDASGNLIRATKPGGGMNLVNLEGFSHDAAISEYESTETCLGCHQKEGDDFVDSIHYTWQGTATNVIGKEGMETGKRKAVNEFCGTIASNEAMCGKCHAGYGLIEGDFSMEKIDCLICHAPDYAKTATGPDPSIDATAAARNVAAPTREMCLRCHATAGGGDNRKRGDVELGMMTDLELEMMGDPKPAIGDLDAAMGATDVSRDLDVHMSMDMTCQDCHEFEDHHVPGRGMDLRVDDTDTVLSCDDAKCHGSAPHTGTSIEDSLNNMHTDKLACTVCHITSYGKEHPVEIARNWELPFMAGMRTEVSNPAPIQVWWNRKSEILDLEDPVVFDSNGDVIMAKPVGDIGDPTSKIYAARLHLGRSPWDGTYMLAFNVPTAKGTKNMTEAVRVATGVTYDPLQFINSTRYLGIFHGVAPKEDALTCSDCHDRSRHKLDYEALGYDVVKDASGNLISATKPGSTLNLATLTEGATGPGTGEPVSADISSWTLPSAGTRGTSISATVNIANTGTETNWFVVSISGTQTTTGYPIVSTGTVRLDAGDSTGVPVMVTVPGSADTGSYSLTPVVYELDGYPAGDPKAIGSGKSVTIS